MATEELAPTLAAVLEAPLKTRGSDVPEGSYPGTLFTFGEPFMIEGSAAFAKPGVSNVKAVFEVGWAVRTKDGSVQSIDYLLPVISQNGGAHRRSKLYKMLRALRGSDPKFFKQDGSGDFADGITLRSFIDSSGVVQVKKNKKDFPVVETIASPIDGLKYPTKEECEKLIARESEEVPF